MIRLGVGTGEEADERVLLVCRRDLQDARRNEKPVVAAADEGGVVGLADGGREIDEAAGVFCCVRRRHPLRIAGVEQGRETITELGGSAEGEAKSHRRRGIARRARLEARPGHREVGAAEA